MAYWPEASFLGGGPGLVTSAVRVAVLFLQRSLDLDECGYWKTTKLSAAV